MVDRNGSVPSKILGGDHRLTTNATRKNIINNTQHSQKHNKKHKKSSYFILKHLEVGAHSFGKALLDLLHNTKGTHYLRSGYDMEI